MYVAQMVKVLKLAPSGKASVDTKPHLGQSTVVSHAISNIFHREYVKCFDFCASVVTHTADQTFE